ncbi:MAG: glycosyltransferase 87 family protein [Flavisolibacter sp.]
MKFVLNSDPQEMKKRLWRQPALDEFFALALAFGMTGLFVWAQHNLSFVSVDFNFYLEAARRNFNNQNLYFYYGYWILPIFTVLSKLPFDIAYVLWNSILILGVFFAVRVFGGKAIIAIASYQMFSNLFYGNIAGLIVGGLGLGWYGIVNKKWHLAGLGIALASAKYQIGLSGSLLLILATETTWGNRLRVFIIPVIVWISSLVVYPNWPLQAYNTIQNHPPDALASISLWRWIGPWSILLLVPPFLLRLKPQQRFLALMAATYLALPYDQQGDLLILLVLPIGWIGLLGNVGYFKGLYGWGVLQRLFFFPLIIYGMTLIPELHNLFGKPATVDENQNIKTP